MESLAIFAVQKNSHLGRFAIAKRDLEAGELLFEEVPFAFGPKARSPCICLECHCPVDGTASGSRCEKCSWPLCVNCVKLKEKIVHERECEVFQSAGSKFYNLSESDAVCVQLDCITPLRIVLEKESNPSRWNEEVEPMEDHRNKRFETAAWNADKHNVAGYLLGPCKLKQHESVDEELIQRVIGLLEVNAFEGKSVKGHAIRCLFPKISVLSHSCTPNTTHAIHASKGFRFVKNFALNCIYCSNELLTDSKLDQRFR